jgi:N-formylglutamate amidohydrolase
MLMITVVHAGELVPPEAGWLKNADRAILLTDIDRFVDQLYRPGAEAFKLPMEVMEIHRYALDLNRLPSDVDSFSVEGVPASTGKKTAFVSGFHWVKTTQGKPLMLRPISRADHELLVEKYYAPFHERVKRMEEKVVGETGLPRFHIDAHSMPSVASRAHQDAGKERPDIVVSDCSGKSCHPEYKDLVIRAYQEQGFEVSYNWPYLGGRMTEAYGKPEEGRHSVQIELKRSLYMDEMTREKHSGFERISSRIKFALNQIAAGIADRGLRSRLHGA